MRHAAEHEARIQTATLLHILLFLTPSLSLGQTATVSATVETVPVPSKGDAADDTALWIHPTSPELSAVICTDKKAGLAVYDLAGKQLQFLPDGRMNSVDVRPGFPLSAGKVALVVASDRELERLALYTVRPDTRTLVPVAARNISLGMTPHGACMFTSPRTGDTYVFCTSKEGHVQQWKLFPAKEGTEVDATLVRSFDVNVATEGAAWSESEGCVADDENGWLFVTEEDVGIWRYGAEPDAGNERVLVDSAGEGHHLDDDVEGLTIYYAKDGAGYLIASSQGSSTFEVYERRPPHRHAFSFRIGANPELGIDAVSDTDGIDVTNLALGAAFPAGVFLAQDDSKPNANQNFKLVPWPAIASAATPPLIVDPSERAVMPSAARGR